MGAASNRNGASHEPIEWVRPTPQGAFTGCFLDFDGTLSLLRRQWQRLMMELIDDWTRQATAELGPRAEAAAEAVLRDAPQWVTALIGKPTILQMERLADEIRIVGGSPLRPGEYKQAFLDRLMRRVRRRLEMIERKRRPPDVFLVPGSRAFLNGLKLSGVSVRLASGTERARVVEEAQALQVLDYFDAGVFGPHHDGDGFNKLDVLTEFIDLVGGDPQRVIGFGDGVTEIMALKQRGAYAVAVASRESGAAGVDREKRQVLLAAGADAVTADLHSAGLFFGDLFPQVVSQRAL